MANEKHGFYAMRVAWKEFLSEIQLQFEDRIRDELSWAMEERASSFIDELNDEVFPLIVDEAFEALVRLNHNFPLNDYQIKKVMRYYIDRTRVSYDTWINGDADEAFEYANIVINPD